MAAAKPSMMTMTWGIFLAIFCIRTSRSSRRAMAPSTSIPGSDMTTKKVSKLFQPWGEGGG